MSDDTEDVDPDIQAVHEALRGVVIPDLNGDELVEWMFSQLAEKNSTVIVIVQETDEDSWVLHTHGNRYGIKYILGDVSEDYTTDDWYEEVYEYEEYEMEEEEDEDEWWSD